MISSGELRNRLKLNGTRKWLQNRRLQWFGIERIKESACSNKRKTVKVHG